MLTFESLREGNLQRLPFFRNAQGELVHQGKDSDWTISDWFLATMGEFGDAANILKKVRRKDFTLQDARQALWDEFGDVQTYFDILAHKCDVDLGEATRAKWNRVSEKQSLRFRIG